MADTTDPMIEVGRGKYLRKSSILSIGLSKMPHEASIQHAGEPCVTITVIMPTGVEYIRCHSTDEVEVNRHMKWLLSHFETVSIPPGSPFGQKVQPEEPL
jgi:hypothetical protein